MKRLWYVFKDDVPAKILSFLSVLLIGSSFLVPPTGVIDPSVLAAVGEIFAFASLITVSTHLYRGKDAKIKHNNTEITFGDVENR